MYSFKKYLAIGFVLLQSYVHAQVDTVNYHVQTMTAHASQEYLPLWIVSNRYGILQDGTDILLRAGLVVPYRNSKKFGISFGLDMVGKVNDAFLQQGYLKIRYGKLELRGGRIEETTGTHYESLSTGSLAQSRNARAVPKIDITFPEYVNVPFTNGYLKIKGYFGHGWLEKDRVIASPYLHEKNLYVKGGGKLPVNAYFGLVHYAIWSGSHRTEGKIPSGFGDFLRVITGSSANENSDKSYLLGGEINNVSGNHFGIFDLGLTLNLKEDAIILYNQIPFEDHSGTGVISNKDRLLGVNWQSKNEKRIVSSILYEYMHTTYQSGPGIPDYVEGQSNYGYKYRGRDDYYNNYFYRTGWTYFDRIIGTPLFLTTTRAEYYFGEINNYRRNIVNNRIVAHHVGFKGLLSNLVQYKALATFTRNWGTYAGLNQGISEWASMDPSIDADYVFDPPLDQVYLLLECNTQLTKCLALQTALGIDLGSMTQNYGGLLGLKWEGGLTQKNK